MFVNEDGAQPNFSNTILSKHLPRMTFVMQTFYQNIVVPSGYPFFEWSGRVYAVQKNSAQFPLDTGVLAKDLS